MTIYRQTPPPDNCPPGRVRGKGMALRRLGAGWTAAGLPRGMGKRPRNRRARFQGRCGVKAAVPAGGRRTVTLPGFPHPPPGRFPPAGRSLPLPPAARGRPARRQQQRAPQLEGRDVPLLHAVADILVDEIGQVAGGQQVDVAPDIAGLKGLFAGHCFTSCLRICIRRR